MSIPVQPHAAAATADAAQARDANIHLLEYAFSLCTTPTEEQIVAIAQKFNSDARTIGTWFENRRDRSMLEGHTRAGMDMMAFTSSEPDFTLRWASDDWLKFCGFTHGDIDGKTFRILQGPETNPDTLDAIMAAVHRQESITTTLLNYTKNGVPFLHTVTIEPLVDSLGKPAMYMVRSQNVLSVPPIPTAVAMPLAHVPVPAQH